MDVTDDFYASDGFIGYGTQLLVGQDDGSPETFVAVYGVSSIKPGKLTAGVADKTHLRSVGRAREKKATIRDYENFSVTGQWNPKHGSQSNAGGDGFTGGGLLALHRTLAERNFKLLLSDGSPATEWPFRGTVTGFDPGEIGLDQIVTFTAEITPLSDFTGDLP